MVFNSEPSCEYREFVRETHNKKIWLLEDTNNKNPFLDSLISLHSYQQHNLGILNSYGYDFNFEAFYIENKYKINASVGKKKRKYCICMNTLTLFFVKNLSYYLFTDDYFLDFLSNIPTSKLVRDIRLGDKGRSEFMKLFTHPINLEQYTFNDYKPPFKPSREERAIAAGLLSNIMLEMIWFHEVGHILSGHVDYMRDSFNINMVSEEEQKFSLRNRFITPIERQQMEMYADMYAIQPRLMIAKERFSSGVKWTGFSEVQYVSFLRMAFYLLNLTWCFVDMVYEQDGQSILRGLTHPPSAYRLFFGNENFSTVMKALGFDQKVIQESNKLHSKHTSHLFGHYEVFYLIATTIQGNQDIVFNHGYKMNGAKKYAEKWSPFAYFSSE